MRLVDEIIRAYQEHPDIRPAVYYVWVRDGGVLYADCFAILYYREYDAWPSHEMDTARLIASVPVLQETAHEKGYDFVLSFYQGWHGLDDWHWLPKRPYRMARYLATMLGAVNPDCPWQEIPVSKEEMHEMA